MPSESFLERQLCKRWKTTKVAIALGIVQQAIIFSPGRESLNRMAMDLSRAKGRFLDNENGTFTDLATGLMWEKEPCRKDCLFFEAALHCLLSDSGGYSDWRLPSPSEIKALANAKPPFRPPRTCWSLDQDNFVLEKLNLGTSQVEKSATTGFQSWKKCLEPTDGDTLKSGLTAAQVERLFGVRYGTMERWIADGKIAVAEVNGERVFEAGEILRVSSLFVESLGQAANTLLRGAAMAVRHRWKP